MECELLSVDYARWMVGIVVEPAEIVQIDVILKVSLCIVIDVVTFHREFTLCQCLTYHFVRRPVLIQLRGNATTLSTLTSSPASSASSSEPPSSLTSLEH